MAKLFRRSRKIEVIRQMEVADCGAACLAMVLAYYGKRVPLDEVRQVTGGGRSGLDAHVLLQAARWFGLEGQGAAFDLDHLPNLQTGAILHWKFTHFIVFERCSRKGVWVVDPEWGRRLIPYREFSQSFTGIGLILAPGADFQTTASANRLSPWRHVKQMVRFPGMLWKIFVTSILIQILSMGLPLLTGTLVDRILPQGDVQLLYYFGLGLIAMTLFHFLGSLVRSHLLLYLRTHVDHKMTVQFLTHLIQLPYMVIQARSSGDLLARVNSNTKIRDMLTTGVLSGLLDGVTVGLYLVLLLIANPFISGLAVSLGLLQGCIFLLFRHRYLVLNTQGLEAQAKSQGFLVQVLSGLETLKSTGAEQRAARQWTNLFVQEIHAGLRKDQLGATMDALLTALRVGSPLLILFVGGIQVLNASSSLGAMLGQCALAGSYLVSLSGLLSTAVQVQQIYGFLDRINDILDKPREQEGKRYTPDLRLQGQVVLDRVSFQYSPVSSPAVREVSVKIEPGEFIAIVGPSGSGKSTLAALLAGLYEPSSGKIIYDGHDFLKLDLQWVRGQIGVVPQHPYLFGISIRENLALADLEAAPERIKLAAELAIIHEDIMAMPMKYGTILGEDGASLSGGQRQRLALARALVNDPVILMLDEATSALDTVTERRVQEALAKLKCTKIIIAQRLSTIMEADRIFVMNGGRIVEQGKHHDLIRTGGVYSELVRAQSL
ncbi:peptidase domain-containing ABC transporter [Paenibacillus allorhizosphaerae]|uniref:Lactococcin-G-processing and transport ATP-binding protein LagD n=1 Tax=Paenibacillus allorhizosphaerae TaxID=2849866 RepID=A0ABN7TV13_9BACL|nr:peptidase domain-containing ABC transporter [Paenibacillus allorhizosphaerae]CAG7656897.1 Lactococcin-G-processing and transport ATP-binding protein LagD [Paenibacillus allorhizosphaerae]